MEEMVKFAVEWWKKAITRDSGTAGDESIDNMHRTFRMLRPATTEQVEKFGEVLTLHLTEAVNKLSSNTETITLGCDYHPERLLNVAQEAAGVSETLFPFKTYMYVSKMGIRLAEGYGSRAKWVYPV